MAEVKIEGWFRSMYSSFRIFLLFNAYGSVLWEWGSSCGNKMGPQKFFNWGQGNLMSHMRWETPGCGWGGSNIFLNFFFLCRNRRHIKLVQRVKDFLIEKKRIWGTKTEFKKNILWCSGTVRLIESNVLLNPTFSKAQFKVHINDLI